MLIKPNSSNKALKIVVLGSPKSGKSAVTVRYLTKRFIGEYSSKDFLYHQTLNINNNTMEIEVLDTSDCKTNQCLIDHILWAQAFIIIYSICDLNSFLYAKKLIEKIFTIKSTNNHHVISSSLLSDNIDHLTEANNNESFKCLNNENMDFNLNNNQLPVILIGNFRDLEHNRQVLISEVEELALKYQILFYETSAAESYISVSLAFQSLIREATQCLKRDMQLSTSSKLINRQLIDCYSNDYFKSSNICERSNSSSSDEKYQVVNRRKSMTVSNSVSKMINIVFGSKSARQKKRPSLSI